MGGPKFYSSSKWKWKKFTWEFVETEKRDVDGDSNNRCRYFYYYYSAEINPCYSDPISQPGQKSEESGLNRLNHSYHCCFHHRGPSPELSYIASFSGSPTAIQNPAPTIYAISFRWCCGYCYYYNYYVWLPILKSTHLPYCYWNSSPFSSTISTVRFATPVNYHCWLTEVNTFWQ